MGPLHLSMHKRVKEALQVRIITSPTQYYRLYILKYILLHPEKDYSLVWGSADPKALNTKLQMEGQAQRLVHPHSLEQSSALLWDYFHGKKFMHTFNPKEAR